MNRPHFYLKAEIYSKIDVKWKKLRVKKYQWNYIFTFTKLFGKKWLKVFLILNNQRKVREKLQEYF